MSVSSNFQPARCRFWCILQLCLVFTVLCWNAGYPFLGSLYHFRSQAFLYQYVLGEGELAQRSLAPELLARQKSRFYQLSESLKQNVLTNYRILQQAAECHWGEQCRSAIDIVIWKMAPLLRLWLFLGAVLAIMLLLRVAGATQAVWLLPLAAVAYSVDNHLYTTVTPFPADYVLYPTETDIVSRYLEKPLSTSINEQREQLTLAWQRYIVDQWSPSTSDSDIKPVTFEMQLEEGEYLFSLARLQRLIEYPQLIQWRYRHSNGLLGCLIVWSFLFAWRCSALERTTATYRSTLSRRFS